ncbi:MAG TPA: hypothetical protein VMK66_13655 [Myxococcales bacterium]|nr:hypothetical protein [Myxococcales bacterium]
MTGIRGGRRRLEEPMETRPSPAGPPAPAPVRLPIASSGRPPKPGYQRAIEVGLRSLHIVSMGLVLGGIAAGGGHEALRWPIFATLGSGLLLLLASMGWGCFRFSQGSGAALLAKLLLLGLGNVFDSTRLQWYVAATIVTSIGSHMPASWRHFPISGQLRSLAGPGART